MRSVSSAAAGSASQCSVMLVAMRSNGPSAVGRAASNDVEADALLARDLKIAPALLDHGRCEVGEEECPIGIAREQMPAEQSGAAAKLEHAGRCALRQQACQPLRHTALQISMLVIGGRTCAEALGDGGATAGEHAQNRRHDGRTIEDASEVAHGRRSRTSG